MLTRCVVLKVNDAAAIWLYETPWPVTVVGSSGFDASELKTNATSSEFAAGVHAVVAV